MNQTLNPTLKPSEILQTDLDLLGENGEHWAQGAYERATEGGDCFCGVGAVRTVVFGTTDLRGASIATSALIDYNLVREALNARVGYFIGWQDEANRTFAEVKAKYLEAIAFAEASELNREAA